MSRVFTLTNGYGSYAFVILFFTLCGLGAQRLCAVPFPRPLRWLLGPAIGQAVVACVLGVTVALGIGSVRDLTPALWLAFGLLALVGLWDAGQHARDARGSGVMSMAVCLTCAAVLPFALLWPYSSNGLADYRGSGLSDGWAYVAIGQHFWDHARGTFDYRSLFHAYGTAFEDVRFISSTQMAFLSSVLRFGDTQSALGLFEAAGLCSTLAACAAFAWTQRLSLAVTLLYLAVCGLSGWFANVLWANNCDHLLALAYMPAFFASIGAPGTLTSKRPVLALLTAGLIYTYPEMAWLTLGAALLWAWQWMRDHPAERLWPTMWRVVAVACVVTSPFLVVLGDFFLKQVVLSIGRAGTRAGEGMFPGLIAPSWMPSAFWALGGEHRVTLLGGFDPVVAIALCAILTIGLVRLMRTRQYALGGVTLGIVGLALAFAFGSRYGYGTYKILLSGWWLLAWCLVTGAVVPRAARVPAPSTRPPTPFVLGAWRTLAIGGLLVMVPISLAARNARMPRTPVAFGMAPITSIAPFRALREVAPIVGSSPVAIVLADLESTYWAFYYLRDARVRLPRPRGYLTTGRPRAHLALVTQPAWEDVRYVLIDTTRATSFVGEIPGTRVWHHGGFELWDTGAAPWVLAMEANTPNGFQPLAGQPFFWMGGGATRIALVARRAGEVALTARFAPGPSGDMSTNGRRLRIRDGLRRIRVERVSPGEHTLRIPVAVGFNAVNIAALDRVVRPILPNGDRRALLLGVAAPRLTFVPADDTGAPGGGGVNPRPQRP